MNIDNNKIKDFKEGWFGFFDANMIDLVEKLNAGEKLTDEDKTALTEMVNKYKTNFFK